jgi:hypothetical protein
VLFLKLSPNNTRASARSHEEGKNDDERYKEKIRRYEDGVFSGGDWLQSAILEASGL